MLVCRIAAGAQTGIGLQGDGRRVLLERLSLVLAGGLHPEAELLGVHVMTSDGNPLAIDFTQLLF